MKPLIDYGKFGNRVNGTCQRQARPELGLDDMTRELRYARGGSSGEPLFTDSTNDLLARAGHATRA